MNTRRFLMITGCRGNRICIPIEYIDRIREDPVSKTAIIEYQLPSSEAHVTYAVESFQEIVMGECMIEL